MTHFLVVQRKKNYRRKILQSDTLNPVVVSNVHWMLTNSYCCACTVITRPKSEILRSRPYLNIRVVQKLCMGYEFSKPTPCVKTACNKSSMYRTTRKSSLAGILFCCRRQPARQIPQQI